MVGSNEKRLFRVTAGNLRNNHLYVNGHHDFFPRDCVGGAKRSAKAALGIEIALDGLNETVSTDIGSDAKTGKPRGYFRGRTWVRKFYVHHGIQPGTVLSLERLSARKYRLSVEPNGNEGRRKPRAAEFFSGIGLVRLALENQGWQIVFANDIDPDKAEMYRRNWPKDDHLVVKDIHGLKSDDIRLATSSRLLFPCNDLSIAGRWEGLSGKESSAFWGGACAIAATSRREPQCLCPSCDHRQRRDYAAAVHVALTSVIGNATCDCHRVCLMIFPRIESAISWQRRISSTTLSHWDQ